MGIIRQAIAADYLIIEKYLLDFNIKSNKLFMLDPFQYIYVYELNNEIIAFIDYSIIYERAELNYIYVHNDYRNKNIGSDLMKFFIDKALESNCINITLEVSKKNSAAINLYTKFGFKEKVIRKNYYHGCDGLLMLKELMESEK